ncbi:MAG: prepilin-type N-terminal cleavage/methylation domain-containing protein [Patescibacteria group bacterium]
MSKFRGFSLIEVTVSIFIMGVIILLLQALIQSGVLLRISKSQSIALSIVQNKLESLRADGYAALPPSGTFSDSLVSALPQAATTTLTVSVYNAQTKQISASVVWRDPGATASSTVSLSTLITETGGLP